MDFSVIIPVYNVKEYLTQCIESVLQQNYDSYECIIVDDGSTDGSSELCDTYLDNEHVKVIHKSNNGLSSARNTGIANSKGDFLLFLDSDDFWIKTDFLKHLKDLISNYHPEVVGFRGLRFDNRSKCFIDSNFKQGYLKSTDDPIRNISTLVQTDRLIVSACHLAVLRSFILKHDLTFRENIKSEDIEWSIRLYSNKPKIAYLGDTIYAYRKFRDGSITTLIDYKHMCDYVTILADSINCINKFDILDNDTNSLMSYIMYQTILASALLQRTPMNGKQRDEIASILKLICKKHLLKHTMNPKVKYAATIYRFGGYNLMSKILGTFLICRPHFTKKKD